MKLTIGERYAIINILPEEANFITIKAIKELREQLAPSDEEIEEMEIKMVRYPDGKMGTQWSKEKAEVEKSLKLGDTATSVVEEKLIELNKSNKLTVEMFSIYEKFIKTDSKK